MKTIDGRLLKNLFISGSNNLYNFYPEVDALNVFPIPDGDTGLNMNLTLTSGVKAIQDLDDDDISHVSKAFSKATLMGARGNSGSISSQIFRGLSIGLDGKKSVDSMGLSEAFTMSSKTAYKAVISPVEGTILTVIREASEELANKVNPSMSIEEAFKILVAEAKESLKRTPNLLPVLKEVGVVDSGGAGLVYILEGMNSCLNGDFIDRNEASSFEVNGQAQVMANENNDEFGYCTEFVLRLGPDSTKKPFNKTRFTNVLGAHGNSLVVIQDDDLVKVHIHTLTPGSIFNYAQQFGEFLKMKCENMTEQHNEILLHEKNGTSHIEMAAAKLSAAPLPTPKAPIKEVENALIATSSGKGVDQLFKDVGVNYIVSGGQTMNPSTSDFVKLIEDSHAKHVYLFPNNGNIILTANAAKEVMEGKCDVEVVPTKTIMQGVSCVMNFNGELSKHDNLLAMNEAINSVKSGSVTFAIKDSEINGVKVKKNEYLAIKESKTILSSHHFKIDALKDVLSSLIDKDSAIITILFGEDVNAKEKNDVKKYISKKYKDLDVDYRDGEQPVYSFIVGIE